MHVFTPELRRLDGPAAPYTNVRDTPISVTGRDISEEVSTRLNLCIENHKPCPKPSDSILPTRVIDVHPEVRDGFVCIRITKPEDRSRYLALSYRWGGEQEVTTTRATFLERQRGIPLDGLPQTIRDAIHVTRDLGFRYLWIDALCIVQDDSADKNLEISRMGLISKNANLTIAAANTTSARESFLAARVIPRSCTVPYLLPDGTFGTLWIKRLLS
jgi:hypothetical protein